MAKTVYAAFGGAGAAAFAVGLVALARQLFRPWPPDTASDEETPNPKPSDTGSSEVSNEFATQAAAIPAERARVASDDAAHHARVAKKQAELPKNPRRRAQPFATDDAPETRLGDAPSADPPVQP